MHKITGTIGMSLQAPSPQWGPGAHVWDVELRYRRRVMRAQYTTGSALGEPTLANVVGCVAQDCSGIDGTFEDWAESFGWDPDSRRAESTYRAVIEQDRRFRKLLGDSGLYEALVRGAPNVDAGIAADDDIELRAERVVIEPTASA